MKRLAIIFSILFLCGVLLSLAAFAMGADTVGRFTKNGFVFGEQPDEYILDVISQDITAIDIDMDYVSNFNVSIGDSLSVEYNAKYVDVSVDGDSLEIASTGRDGYMMNFGFSDFGILGTEYENDIKIILPRDLKLTNFEADIDSGNLYFSDIVTESFDVQCYFGNLVMDNIEAESLGALVNSGDIVISDCEADMMDIINELGATQLIDTSIGAFWSLLSTGDISLDNVLISQKGEIEVSLGSVSLDLIGKADDYKISANLDLGTLEYDGKTVPTPTVIGDGDVVIDVMLNVGDMSIEFS